MIKLISDETQFNIYSNLIPITFMYDVMTKETKVYINVLSELVSQSVLSNLKISINDNIVFLSEHADVIKQNEHNVYIVTKIDNIFETYITLNSIMDNFYDRISNRMYYHIKTSKRCNMKCPYCASGTLESQLPVFHIKYKGLIQSLVENVAKRLNYTEKTVCIMGGEPFLYIDEFSEAVEFDKTVLSNLFVKNHITIFTNNTANTKECINVINESGIFSDKQIILSMDSLDVSKSEKLRSKNQLEKFNTNFKFINDECLDYRISVNIMYKEYEQTKKLIEHLGENSRVKNIQVSFNNLDHSYSYNKDQNTLNTELMNYANEMYKMNKIKSQHFFQFPIHFKIKEMDKTLFTLKLSYKTDSNYMTIYQYDQNNPM